MSRVTDPLREYIAKTWDGSMYVNQVPMRLLEIADEIETEHERLEQGNAKLREERDMYRDLVDCMVHPDIPDQLAAENAKLRELLQEAVDGISTKDIRDWRFGKRLAFLRKARELGIEADE